MNYGNSIPLDPEIIDALKPCPFQLLHNDKSWSLLKLFSCNIENTKINIPVLIKQFDNIEALFLDLFASGNWYCTLSPSQIKHFEDCIQFVFLTKDGTVSSHKRRYQMFKQFERRTPISSQSFSIPFLSDLYEKASASGLPTPSTPTEALTISEKNKYSPPETNIIMFKECYDLARWAFEHLIDHYREIARCKNCNHYFIKNTNNRKYCSIKCARECSTTGSHLGESQIKKLYHIIDQRFRRKIKSQSIYSFNGMSFDNSSFDAHELFTKIEDTKIKSNPIDSLFSAEHFIQINKAYKASYKSRYQSIKKAKEACLNSDISEEEYQNTLQPFLAWLSNVVKFLDAFSIDQHSRSL